MIEKTDNSFIIEVTRSQSYLYHMWCTVNGVRTDPTVPCVVSAVCAAQTHIIFSAYTSHY